MKYEKPKSSFEKHLYSDEAQVGLGALLQLSIAYTEFKTETITCSFLEIKMPLLTSLRRCGCQWL